MCRDHQCHCGGQQVQVEPRYCRFAPASSARQVAAAVQPGQDREAKDGKQKECRQGIDFDMQTPARHRPTARHSLRLSGDQHAGCGNQSQSGTRHSADLARHLRDARSSAKHDSQGTAKEQQHECSSEFKHLNKHLYI